MKHFNFALFALLTLIALSCEKFTDIRPKGSNLLETADQLEMLLCNNLDHSSDLYQQTGDIMYCYDNIPTRLANPAKVRRTMQWIWEEENMDIFAELTASDTDYSTWYGWVGKVCNPIIEKVDDATGDSSQKNRIKTEAYAMRAFMHYLLVNKFAKAYNPATAANDPGIAYLTEETDITVPTEKLSVQEVYDNILADINKAIELNGLPNNAVHKMRFNKPAMYSVKALVLLSMQQFAEAEAAAKEALAINNSVLDFSTVMTTLPGTVSGKQYPVIYKPLKFYDEDYFVMYPANIYYETVSPEAMSRFEKGHMFLDCFTNLELRSDYQRDAEYYVGVTDGQIVLYDFDSYWNRAGLTAPMMHLVVAEAEISKGNIDAAMDALDKVRENRIAPVIYTPLKGVVKSKTDAITHLKQTVHGEYMMTIWNFITRKRWNQLHEFVETYNKTLMGKVYSLRPDSPMWIFPFPKNVTDVNPNMTQNY